MKQMKRTKNINHNRFRKVQTFWKYSALFIAIGSTFFLTACDEYQEEKVSVYRTIQDCESTAANQAAKDRCALDYQNALLQSSKVAPKYNSKQDCEDEFGAERCTAQENTAQNVSTSSGSHSSFMWFPLMSGYSSSSANYPSQALYSSTKSSSPAYGRFVDAKGNSFGSFKSSGTSTVTKSALQAKAPTTTTITRSGFGATVSRMSASHSSHSSGSHSSGG